MCHGKFVRCKKCFLDIRQSIEEWTKKNWGRQTLKNFNWSILECFVSYISLVNFISIKSRAAISLKFQLLRGKCPYSEFFWSVFSRIWTAHGPEKTPNADTFHEVSNNKEYSFKLVQDKFHQNRFLEDAGVP